MTWHSHQPPRWMWVLLALGVALGCNLVLTDGFFALRIQEGRLYGIPMDILDASAPLILIGLGMTLVIATGGIDLSVGSVMAISAALAGAIIAQPESSPVTAMGLPSSTAMALVAAMVVGTAIGVMNGLLIAFGGIQPIVATLTLMVAGRGIAQMITANQIINFRDPLLDTVGRGAWLGLPPTFLIVLIVLCVLGMLVRGSAAGLFIEAVGGNAKAARAAGVPVRTVRLAAYSASGLLAAMGGVLAASDISSVNGARLGEMMELDAILAVVLGGTALIGGRFSFLGTVCGALLLVVIATTITMHDVPGEWTRILKAVAIIVLCLMQSARCRSLVKKAFRRRRSA